MVFYCRIANASTSPGTCRRMCCPTHCDNYCDPCQPLMPAFSGGFDLHLLRGSEAVVGGAGDSKDESVKGGFIQRSKPTWLPCIPSSRKKREGYSEPVLGEPVKGRSKTVQPVLGRVPRSVLLYSIQKKEAQNLSLAARAAANTSSGAAFALGRLGQDEPASG